MTIADQVVESRRLTIISAIEVLLEIYEENPSVTMMELITMLDDIKRAMCV